MSLLENYLTPPAFRQMQVDKLLRRARQGDPAPAAWRERLPSLFGAYLWHPFSPPHVELWEWAASIEVDTRSRPFAAFWPRGRGKSTHAEMLAADLGARGRCRYCLYVSETQDQADKHVTTIQHMLESPILARHYPQAASPRFGRHGSRTWRRGIMTTAGGYTVEAIGLDKAVRGQKIDWARPDLIIFDDVDAKHDTEAAVRRKEEAMTTSILPSGADNASVLFVQNLIHDRSIAHRLSKPSGTPGAADYLADRLVSGPFPAVEGLAYTSDPQADGTTRWRITGGLSLWDGYDLDVCEDEINRAGPSAFNLESQHDIDADNPAALLTAAILDRSRVTEAPANLIEVVIGVDPPGSTGQAGIVGVGKAIIGRVTHGYTLGDFSPPAGSTAETWALAALRAYTVLQADRIVVERNFGGDMVRETIRNAVYQAGGVSVAGRQVRITEVTASRGKDVRAQPVAVLFEQGLAHHVGHYPELERQWTRWKPGDKPSPDRLDAEVWAYTDLFLPRGAGAI